MQGELAGNFQETEVPMNFMSNFQYFRQSLHLFLLGIIFLFTLKYKESESGSLMSVDSLCLEILTGLWRLMRDVIFYENLRIMQFLTSDTLQADLIRISRQALRCRSM